MGVSALLDTQANKEADFHFVSASRTITHKPGQELQESLTETRLKTLLKALPAGVVVLDGEGRVQECNPAAVDLLDEPLLGLSWRTVIQRAFDHTRVSGQDSITNKGQIVSISTCPLGEDVPGQIILLQDVTEKRQLQAKYDQQSRLASMGQMAAQLAHQIRTPISAALLYASHLKTPGLDDDRRLRFADKILTQIQSLEQLINDMLLFSRNGMENRESISISHLLEELQQTLTLPPEKKHLQLKFHFNSEDKGFVSGNRHLLISGVSNLLNNAIDASPAHGQVSLDIIQLVRGTVDFVITDNGSGITEDSVDKIFQPFFTTKEQGTGLGLAVVKAIANAHDGELWLESTGSKGSVFRMRLPVQIQTLNKESGQ